MRRISWILIVLLAAPAAAVAQSTALPSWDVNASAGLFQARPTDDTRGWDDWYSEGRYSASLGYYWTNHFKTEIEFSVTGEARRYTQEIVSVPGVPVPYPVSTELFHRLQQTSARAVWQFNDNAWVHPYLNAGVVYDVERTRRWSPDQFYYPPGDPRVVPRIPVASPVEGTTTDRRAGFTIGGGSKFYVSPNAYINAGLQITRAKPSTTVSLLAGFGIDF
jgi:opacity protein-like surface antigen